MQKIDEMIDKEYQALVDTELFSKRSLKPVMDTLFEAFWDNPRKPIGARDLLKKIKKVDRDKLIETARIYEYRLSNEVLKGYESQYGVQFYILKNGNTYLLKIRYKKDDYLELRAKYKVDEPVEERVSAKIDAYIKNVVDAKTKDTYIPTDVTDKNGSDLNIEDLFKLPDSRIKEERLSVIEGIERYYKEHVLLIGGPGYGKTTALNNFLSIKAQESNVDNNLQVPLLLELRHLTSTIEDLIQKAFIEHGVDMENDEIDSLIERNRLIYLFDGINEIPSEKNISALSDFEVSNPDVPMVFSTRAFSKGEGLMIRRRLEMRPLTKDQIDRYVRICLPEKHPSFPLHLSDPQRKLLNIPLLLKMFISSYESGRDMPLSTGGILQTYCKFFTIQKRDNVSGDMKDRRDIILKEIAFRMMEGDTKEKATYFQYGKNALNIISATIPIGDPKSALEDLIDHHLIINRSDGRIEFVHQMIQEYFAAEYLLEYLPGQTDEVIKCHFLNYVKWTDTIALMLELCKVNNFIQRIIDLAVDVDRYLAARLAGSIVEDLKRDKIKEIMSPHSDENMKIEKFLKIGGKEAIDFMHSLRGLETSPYFYEIFSFLGRHEREDTIERLIAFLNVKIDSSDIRLKKNKILCIKILGEMCASEADEHIRKYFPSIDSTEYIIISLKALRLIQGADAFENYLISSINKDDDSYTKSSKLIALSHHKNTRITKYLIDLLKNKKVKRNVKTTVLVLLDDTDKIKIIDVLDRLLWKSGNDLINDQLSLVIIGTLGGLKDQKAIDILYKILETENDFLKIAAVESLFKLERKISTKNMDFLKSIDAPDLLKHVSSILANVGTKDAVNHLIHLLRSRNNDIIFKRVVINGLRKSKDKEVIDEIFNLFVSLIEGDDREIYTVGVIQDILTILVKNKYIAAIPYIRKIIQNEKDPYLLLSAAEAIAELNGEISEEFLVSLYLNEELYGRGRALELLEEIGNEQTISSLKRCPDILSDVHLRRTLQNIQHKIGIYEPSLTPS